MPLFFDIFIEKEIDSMTKVKALNRDGKITWCTSKTPGQRNCNHVLHQSARMTDGEFQECVDEYNERMLQKLDRKSVV